MTSDPSAREGGGAVVVGLVVAAHPDGDHGLCTACFNGHQEGHDEHGGPARSPTTSSSAARRCRRASAANPEQNGRYDRREGDEKDTPARDSDTDSEFDRVADDGVV